MIAFKEISITPQTVKIGEPISISIKVKEVDWGDLKNDFSSWNEINNYFYNWGKIKDYIGVK